MRICFISDTHRHHRQVSIPDADVLIHCGDMSNIGELDVMKDFSDWMHDLPISHKICIAGNHEVGLQNGVYRDHILFMLKEASVTYLQNSEVVIDGVKFYGSPFTPVFNNWDFQKNRGKELKENWQNIPDDTNVLITHGPPYKTLDLVDNALSRDPHQGCEELRKRIKSLKNLKAHGFGHIHLGYSQQPFIKNGVQFVNAAICTEQYRPTNKPVVIDI